MACSRLAVGSASISKSKQIGLSFTGRGSPLAGAFARTLDKLVGEAHSMTGLSCT